MGRRNTYETTVVGLVPPPGNEAALARLQDRCFLAYGHPSCRALPPIVPLFWLAQSPPSPHPPQVRTPVRRCPSADRLSLHGEALFLSLENESPWTSLRTRLRDVFQQPPGEQLVRPAAGFFLSVGVQKIAAAYPPLVSEPIRFRRLDLAALSVSYAERSTWWALVEWELRWRTRCISERMTTADG